MFNDENIRYAYFIIGSYETVLVALVIVIAFVIPKFKKNCILPFMYMCAGTMFLEFLSSLWSMLQTSLGLTAPFFSSFSLLCDGLIAGMIALSEYSLRCQIYPPLRIWFHKLLPCMGAFALTCSLPIAPTSKELILIGLIAFIACSQFGGLVYYQYLHDMKLYQNFSNLSNITTRWYGIMSFGLMIELLFWTFRSLNSNFYTFMGYQIFMIVFWCVLGYFICTQDKVAILVESEEDSRGQIGDMLAVEWEDIDAEEKNEWMLTLKEKLELLEQTQKFYLDPTYNRDMLVADLGTNRTYLAKYFNSVGITFYDYINALRLKEAEQLMQTTDDKLETIAQASGFHSVRTFGRVFQNAHKVSPSKWRQAH